MARPLPLLLAQLTVPLLLAACDHGPAQRSGSAGNVCERVDGARARALVEAGAQLVDVRTPEEYAKDHVAGAVNVPVTELEGRLSELTRDRPVVVYCRSGNRSAKAASTLCSAGYSVHDFGARSAWPD